MIDQVLTDAAQAYVVSSFVAWALSALGDIDGAIRWTERGFDQRDSYMVTMNRWTHWDPLRGDTRFQALLQRTHFPVGSERRRR